MTFVVTHGDDHSLATTESGENFPFALVAGDGSSTVFSDSYSDLVGFLVTPATMVSNMDGSIIFVTPEENDEAAVITLPDGSTTEVMPTSYAELAEDLAFELRENFAFEVVSNLINALYPDSFDEIVKAVGDDDGALTYLIKMRDDVLDPETPAIRSDNLSKFVVQGLDDDAWNHSFPLVGIRTDYIPYTTTVEPVGDKVLLIDPSTDKSLVDSLVAANQVLEEANMNRLIQLLVMA